MLSFRPRTVFPACAFLAVAAIAGSCSDNDNTSENEAPSVTIYSPENFRTFSAGDNVIIHAVANDPNGTISRLEFYRNETKIGEVEGRHPYEYTWATPDTGRYDITVIAIDNAGARTTSPEVKIRIKENKLLDKQWQLVGRTIDGSDAYTPLEACEKDNIKRFNADGTLTYDEYASKCSITAAQTEKGSWAYNLDHTGYYEIKNARQTDYTLVALTDTVLEIRWTENGVNYTEKYIAL